ncbi:MAG: TRAP transporter large permease subunit [Burkholderiaceae bacterium]
MPGLLIAGSMMLIVHVFARRRGYPVHGRASFAELRVAVMRASLALMTPLLIIGGIVGGFSIPTEASVIAVLYSLVLDEIVLPLD